MNTKYLDPFWVLKNMRHVSNQDFFDFLKWQYMMQKNAFNPLCYRGQLKTRLMTIFTSGQKKEVKSARPRLYLLLSK